MAQPGPNLPVALAVQARAEDPRADALDQLGIGAGPDRTSARRTGRRRGIVHRAMAVGRGAGEAPDAGDPAEAVGAARGRGEAWLTASTSCAPKGGYSRGLRSSARAARWP